MPLNDDDLFHVGRPEDDGSVTSYTCSPSKLKEYLEADKPSTFTGQIVLDGFTLTFSNGLLTDIT